MKRYIRFTKTIIINLKSIIIISLKCNYSFPRKSVAFYEKVYTFYRNYNYKFEIYNYDFTKI